MRVLCVLNLEIACIELRLLLKVALPDDIVIPHFPDHYSRLEDALDSFEDSPYSDKYNAFVSLVN